MGALTARHIIAALVAVVCIFLVLLVAVAHVPASIGPVEYLLLIAALAVACLFP